MSSEVPLQPSTSQFQLQGAVCRVKLGGTIKGEAGVKFQGFMEREELTVPTVSQIMVIEGLKAKGLLPRWYDLAKMLTGW